MNLLILGAGVEKGLGMPLAYELLPGMINFVYDNEIGKNVDMILKNFFKLKENDDFLTSIVAKLEKFKKEELEDVIKKIEALQNKENVVDKQLVEVIKKILSKILIEQSKKKDKENYNITNYINQEDIDKLSQYLPSNHIDSFNDEFNKLKKPSDIKKSQVSRIIKKNILKISIKDPDNEILNLIYKNLIDFESLLLKYFVSLYNTRKDKNFKKNFYISWLLWAYLVWKEQDILKNNKFTKKEEKFYSKLTNKIEIITFNYTSFASKVNHGTIYFHGRLDKFIELNNKNEIDIDVHKEIDIIKVLEDKIFEQINLKEKKYIIPGIVPPLKLKPVLTSNLLEKWCKSKKMIENASKIVIIGYSFNYADEHFNDLIRKNMHKDIIIVNPDIEGIKKNVRNIFSINPNKYIEKKYKEYKVYEKEKLKLIEAKAEDIDVNSLFKDRI